MISWLIEGLIASTMLMVAVLLLRGPVRRAFGAQIGYALWLLPVLRLLLPPLPAAWQAPWQAEAVAPIAQASETVTVLFVDPVAQSAAAAPGVALAGPILAALWIVGAAAFMAFHTLAHRRFCRRMLDAAASRERLGGIEVIATDAASGPLAFGIWRRYVAFPRDFAERFEPEERDLALAHELGHHARGDLIANWVALVVLALHWFNPVAWRAFRAFRADQEIANDARVLAGLNPMRRHTYACAILKAAHPTFLGGTVSATCHLHTIDDLKGRLRMLTTTRTSRTRLIGGAGALALLATAGLGLTASGTAAAAKVRSSVETATGVDLASLDQAVAPPAPPAPATSSSVASPVAPRPPAPLAKPGIVDETSTTPDGRTVRTRMIYRDDEVPQTLTVSGDGKERKVIRIIRRDKDGSIATDTLAAIPDVKVQNCKGAVGGAKGDTSFITNETHDGTHRMVICVNRIQKVAADGAAMAANGKDIERNAYARALEGLRAARARMTDSNDMTGTQRTAALDGIDQAIREIEGDLAKVK